MKKYIGAVSILIATIAAFSCINRGPVSDDDNQEEVSSVPDTGFTGIKKYYSQNLLTYQATFKNGVREGLMTTFYESGKIRQTFWYKNGVREDTAVWYHEDGKIFRKTPFRNDSMNGVQIQYYKDGKVRAKLEFRDGLRLPYLEEWSSSGNKITDYPDVILKITDTYSRNGIYSISARLDREDVKANFYVGEYEDGLFVPKKYKKINDSETTAALQLKKSGTGGRSYVGIIAEISTSLGNKYLVYKRTDLPYGDLK